MYLIMKENDEIMQMSAKDYEMLKNWAKADKNEQCGIISGIRDRNRLIPTEFALEDRFAQKKEHSSVETNVYEMADEIFNSKQKVHFLMHTHPKDHGKKGGTGISVGDVRHSLWWEGIKGGKSDMELFMGIAAPNSVSFWKVDKDNVRQLEIELDGEKIEQPDIVKRQSEINNYIDARFRVAMAVIGVLGSAVIAVQDKIMQAADNISLLVDPKGAAEFLSLIPKEITQTFQNLTEQGVNEHQLVGAGVVAAATLIAYCVSSIKDKRTVMKNDSPFLGLKKQMKTNFEPENEKH